MRVLVIDIGGTHVKLYATYRREPLKIDSGPKMTPRELVKAVKANTSSWKYDVISIGYPGPVVHGKPLSEPANLGKGWLGFDFEKAFGRPVKIINDAAMQALGSYRGGRMLFLGLGTGLGSALVVDGVLEPMELAHLPYKHGKTFALQPEYVVLGGGNSKRLKTLPPETIRGNNEDARKGGLRLWDRSRRRTRR
jgi:ROK family